jgi:tRNA dimethylallyltransferase
MKAICLMGPTASGKTALALDIARHYPCEIISVDSALVYRGMDIGTAKPTAAELAQVPHHLIDILDPTESYSAADFRRDALRLIGEITARGHLPLLVGGTMLYFRVLRDGIAELPPANNEIRNAIAQEAGRHGWPALHAELMRVDPLTAESLHPQHSQRIQRALEVFRLTGIPLSQLHAESKKLQHESEKVTEPIRWVQLAVAPQERHVLHQRIAERFEVMLNAGFLDEVAALRQRGDLNPDLPAMRAVGYRQVWDYLSHQPSDSDLAQQPSHLSQLPNGLAPQSSDLERARYAEMIEKGVAATRQLAKRQLTWLRSWPDLCWFYTDEAQRVVGDGIMQSGLLPQVDRPLTAEVLKYLANISI